MDSIDLWVGGLAEDHFFGTSVGPTFRKIIANQFERLRTGDRFWYQRIFFGSQLQALQQTRLSDIIRRNTVITKIQNNVFFFDASTLGTLQPKPGSLPPALIGAPNTRFAAASIDGTGNNSRHSFWGSAGFDLMRFASAAMGFARHARGRKPSQRALCHTLSLFSTKPRTCEMRAIFPIGFTGGGSLSITISISQQPAMLLSIFRFLLATPSLIRPTPARH